MITNSNIVEVTSIHPQQDNGEGFFHQNNGKLLFFIDIYSINIGLVMVLTRKGKMIII